MAFPSNTTLIDDFNRADQGPPPGGPWASGTAFNEAGTGLSISGNALTGASCSKLSASNGPDVDFYWTWAADPAGITLRTYLRGNPTTSSYTGYRLDVYPATSIVRLWRVSSGSLTQVGSNVSYTGVVVGDKVGIEVRGGTFKVYTNTGSGWTQLASWTDGSPLNVGGGQFGIAVGGGGNKIDDFSGGDAVTTVVHEGSASWSGESDWSAAGEVSHPVFGSASWSGDSNGSAAGSLVAGGSAALSGQSDVSASGLRILTASVVLSGSSDLAAIAVGIFRGSAGLAGASNAIVNGSRLVTGGADLTGQSGWTATGLRLALGSASFSGESELLADWSVPPILGSASWSGQSGLEANGVIIAIGSLVLSGESDWLASSRGHKLSPGIVAYPKRGLLTGPSSGAAQRSRAGRVTRPRTGRITSA